MATPTDHPQNSAERLIVAAIGCTWLFWVTGALYIVGPALGWVLGMMALSRWYLGQARLGRPAAFGAGQIALLLWLAGMMLMLLVLFVGHANFALGLAKTVKSAIGWAKGWALMALFPLAGAMLQIRSELIARALARLGIQTLVLLPLFALAPFIGLPGTLWISPLNIVGGSGPEFFAATLYTIDPSSGLPRWQFFAPWSPAAGVIAVINLAILSKEKSVGWKVAGIAAWVLVALMSQSRLAVLLVLFLPVFFIGMRYFIDTRMLLVGAVVILLAGIFGPLLISGVESAFDEFRSARAGSSRVRETLARIAIDRWREEAPWFGHGIVENGPHLVEYMPIGSHHSWYGLLFVKGILGVFALGVPFVATIYALGKDSLQRTTSRAALAISILLLAASFGENLEIIAYLVWPGLIVVGCALSEVESAEDSAQSAQYIDMRRRSGGETTT